MIKYYQAYYDINYNIIYHWLIYSNTSYDVFNSHNNNYNII